MLGAAAEMVASRKEDKYVDLGARYIFEPIAVETLGVFNASARHLADLGRRISINTPYSLTHSGNTGEARETSYLFQRISFLVERFTAVLLHNSLPAADCTDWHSYPPLYCLVNFGLPRERSPEGQRIIIIINNNQKVSEVRWFHGRLHFPAHCGGEPGTYQCFNTGFHQCSGPKNISYLSGDDREAQFLFQRISVTIQRFNSVLLHDSFSVDCPDQ